MSGSFGEPAFLYALPLMDHFQDAPEGREGKYAQEGWSNQVTDPQRSNRKKYASKGKQDPASDTHVIFRFYDQRMEKSDD